MIHVPNFLVHGNIAKYNAKGKYNVPTATENLWEFVA